MARRRGARTRREIEVDCPQSTNDAHGPDRHEPRSARSAGLDRRLESAARVAVVMGSASDWETLRYACETFEALGVPHERRVLSAHRMPEEMAEWARTAEARGLRAIIAGAGGAAHLPGMVAAHTLLPVFGVPVESAALRGLDSLLSIVQMPAGIPVGTLAIGRAGAINAALLVVAVLAPEDPALRERWAAHRRTQSEQARTAALP